MKNLEALRYPLESKEIASGRYIIYHIKKFKVEQKTEESSIIPIYISSIMMNVPNNFSENISQNWGAKGVMGADSFASALSGMVRNGLGTLKEKLDGRTVNEIVKKNRKIINTREELLFDGPNLRTFTFDYELSARNQAESTSIQKIVSTFKNYMCPEGSQSSTLLEFPALFSLELSNAFTKMGWPPGKLFALTDMVANHTAEGAFLTFVDGSPVKTSLSLTFTETTPFLRSDLHDEGI